MEPRPENEMLEDYGQGRPEFKVFNGKRYRLDETGNYVVYGAKEEAAEKRLERLAILGFFVLIVVLWIFVGSGGNPDLIQR